VTGVVLVDAGGANLGSVRYAFERLGARVEVSADPGVISAADRVILPGVGAAAAGMARLHELGLVSVLRGLRQPLLGICLGMQLLYESSEEGGVPCLGLLPGRVARMSAADDARIPHMGWNRLELVGEPDPLLDGMGGGEWAYFVHGYAAPVGPETIARCVHGTPFSAVVRAGNRWGAQFHPERSAGAGARLLGNFLSERLQ